MEQNRNSLKVVRTALKEGSSANQTLFKIVGTRSGLLYCSKRYGESSPQIIRDENSVFPVSDLLRNL